MNMMKRAWQKFPCVLGSVFPPIRLCSGLSLATKGIGPLCCTVSTLVTCYFSPATFHLTTPSLVTATLSACSYYLAVNCLPQPSAPRWVRHSYLSKGLWLIPYTCGSSPAHTHFTFAKPGFTRTMLPGQNHKMGRLRPRLAWDQKFIPRANEECPSF